MSCILKALLCFRFNAMAIHGDKSQQDRDYVLAGESKQF